MRPWLVPVVLCVSAAAHADNASSRGAGAGFDPQAIYKATVGSAPIDGPADAPITIVEWSDYACQYCNRVEDTLDRLRRLYPGEIRFVHRTLLLDPADSIATEAALAAAAQGRFRPMHDRMFALRGRVDRAGVELIARELGLDMIRFRADLDAGTYRQAIATDQHDAIELGITSTPTFFVNGRAVRGAGSLQTFATLVDEMLPGAIKIRATHPSDLYAELVAGGKPAADAPSDLAPERADLDPRTAYRVGLGLPGHQLGPDSALVTIVEFSDFQCPYCAKEAPVLAQMRAKYGDQIRIIYRHFPVLFHPDSVIAAEAGAAAADQGKFWAFHDQVFSHFGELSRADLESYAKAAGLDLPRFRAALDERRFHDAVIAEGASGEALGVTGTPTMFLNGQPVVGALDAATLTRFIDAHLHHAQDAIAHGLPATDIYALVMSGAVGEERADPSAIPTTSLVHIEMRPEDRTRAVDAACRRRDPTRAAELARPLVGDTRQRAAAVCAGEGIDLP